MLLTIRTTHQPATDLGFLLHKHPQHVHTREFPFGNATVFYPEAAEDACTAALLLDVDPVAMVRGRGGKDGVEDQYVNDRPYVASSLLSVVLARWFNSALSGRCERKPELPAVELPLEARLAALPCRGGEGFLRGLFEPLGYEVEATRHALDETMPVLGPSRLFTVTLRARRRVSELLAHLYVLVPVLDDQKHYWVGDDEVEKLLRRGEGWLEQHPARDVIVARYLVHQRGLVRDAIARLTAEEQPEEETVAAQKDEQEAAIERPISLNERRLDAVFAALKSSGASRVIDLGCGEGKLLRRLLSYGGLRSFSEGGSRGATASGSGLPRGAGMRLTIPELSLVVLIGASGCGKSTFARKHFKPTEVLSSDGFRALVSDDENEQSATDDAFAALHFVAARRLARARLTVVDATNVQPEARKPLVALAREYHVLPVAIVLDLPERVCHERNRSRPDRDFGPHVVRNQASQLHRSLRGLGREGFRHVHVLKTQEEIDGAVVERQPLWNNRKQDRGPFDIIGDVHGCCDELEELLDRLGYVRNDPGSWLHPEGRKAVFVGDLVDRGPRIVETLKTVMAMSQAGTALCVPGNHDIKLKRKLEGRDVTVSHGLQRTLDELGQATPEFRDGVQQYLDSLVSHYVFDEGRLVVAHAGMKEEMQGRGSAKVRDFALYGETTGETDEFGLPTRYNWAAEYRGRATVVYGHTPVPAPEWLNRTINIDTGCVFGGRLTALRWPEKELVSVPARATYAEPIRPFLASPTAPTLSAQQANDELLDIDDVRGKRLIITRLHRSVTIREENAAAALEVMSRFAAEPKWLIYLPPTMSPSETSRTEGLLEHPAEAFAYYRTHGVSTVVVEQKHMGSRAILIVCRSQKISRERFGIVDGQDGICYTRTGRRFFNDAALERELLATVRGSLDRSGFWARLDTDWVCLDCELMPWSAKALELVRQQYASVGTAARVGLEEAIRALEGAAGRGVEVGALLERHKLRRDLVERFARAYRNYCWPVESLRDIRIAPFHVMATEGAVHADKDHMWHMNTINSFVEEKDGLLMRTPCELVELADPASEAAATAWWTALTEAGGEGAVVKPLSFVATSSRGLLQPAVKCRGREYLRIIYGPEYTLPEHLGRLRERGLSGKRSLALREFALGIEGLERFVQREPLRRVHECVFGVLALESEPVDPRL